MMACTRPNSPEDTTRAAIKATVVYVTSRDAALRMARALAILRSAAPFIDAANSTDGGKVP